MLKLGILESVKIVKLLRNGWLLEMSIDLGAVCRMATRQSGNPDLTAPCPALSTSCWLGSDFSAATKSRLCSRASSPRGTTCKSPGCEPWQQHGMEAQGSCKAAGLKAVSPAHEVRTSLTRAVPGMSPLELSR